MNVIERINAIAELAKKFSELYTDFNREIHVLNVDWDGIEEIPRAHIKGIYNLSRLTGKTPLWVDDYEAYIDYNGVRFFEYKPTGRYYND